MKVVCIGSAPSSGSTLLSDLLDSAPSVVATPELYMFSDAGFYSFDERFKELALNQIPVDLSCCYAKQRPFFNSRWFDRLGLSASGFNELLQSSSMPEQFCEELAKIYSGYRGEKAAIFCEKTPANINHAQEFCSRFPAYDFLHITRNPKTALPSIMRRGFTLYEAVVIWMYQNWVGCKAMEFENYTHLQFETLVSSPFTYASEILRTFGVSVDQATLEENYRKNEYRHSLPKPTQWKSHTRKDLVDKTRLQDELDPKLWAAIHNVKLRVIERDSRVHIIDMKSLCECLGYGKEVFDANFLGDDPDSEHVWANLKEEYIHNGRLVQKHRKFEILQFDQQQKFRRVGDPKKKSSLKVLQGVSGQAGQPEAIARALRERGHYAHSCIIKDHVFDYESGFKVNLPKMRSGRASIAALSSLVNDYDIFHFHARSFLTTYKNLSYPSFLDLIWLKSIGKKIFFHFRGSEIRLKPDFDSKNPYHFTDQETEALEIFSNIPHKNKLILREFVESVADGVLVTDQEIKSYVGQNSIIVPRTVDRSIVGYTPVTKNREKPLVVHAPSRRGVKGTEFVINAINRLKENGVKFDFKLVEGLNNEEAIGLYKDADIVVDQLRIGWYGVLSVEAFALGKPVVCYIREDLERMSASKIPVINANPDTIYSKLRFLIENPLEREKIGKRSYEYFESVHAPDAVAKKLEDVYRLSNKPIEDVDWCNVGGLLDFQMNQYRQENRKEILNLKSNLGRTERALEKLKQKTIKIPKILRPLKRH